MRRLLLPLAAGVLLLEACPGHGGRPVGPPPEYERPALPPWEAAAPESAPEPAEAAEEPAGPAVEDAGPDAAMAADAGDGGDAGPAR